MAKSNTRDWLLWLAMALVTTWVTAIIYGVVKVVLIHVV
jgi:hypothetical protein